MSICRTEFGFLPGLVRVQHFQVGDDNCGFSLGPLPRSWHVNQSLAALQERTH